MSEWDEKAPDLAAARRAIWDMDEPWDAHIPIVLDQIEPALAPILRRKDARILDLGCGVGDLTREMARRHPKVHFIGVDSSAAMLIFAREQPKVGQVRYLQGDGRTLPKVGRLDGAWSVVVFQHISSEVKRGYIREVAERLTSGGVFRFQFVEGDDEASGNAREVDVLSWCEDAGLGIDAVDHGVIFPPWTFFTAVKP